MLNNKRKIEEIMENRVRKIRKKILDMLHNVIFVACVFLAINSVFNIPTANKFAFFIMIPILGLIRYHITEIQKHNEISDIYEHLNTIIIHLITLDVAIGKIQALSTDKDILRECRDEITKDIETMREEFERNFRM